jgi:hypothetical protein
MPQVTIKRTPIGMGEYARAVLRAWRDVFGDTPMKASAAVLWSQYMIETGGKACWNFNIGNVKVSAGQVAAGVDWIDLPGTWEVVNGKRVVLAEGDIGRRFRAFTSLDEAMGEHLGFLRNKRYRHAWPGVELGDYDTFARRLKAAGYYTAPAEDYAKGMAGHYRNFMASQAWEQLLASEAPTQPQLPVAEPTGEMTVQEIADLAQATMASRRAMLSDAMVRRSSEELALDLEKLGEGED